MKYNPMKYTFALVSIAGMALVTSASAQIVESAALSGDAILASQLTDLGPGSQDNSRDYANNTGPAGQTFTVSTAGTAASVAIMGRGDSANSWTTGPTPFNGSEIWALQLGSVAPVTGAITVLDTEFYTGFSAGANVSDFLTFKLQHPTALTTGVTYEWTISIDDAAGKGAPWIGWAHSTGDAYAAGYAMNNNTSLTPNSGSDGNKTPVMGGFAAPNPGNYDYVFAVQVPEPTTVALLSLGGLALVAFRRRA